jgi:hypothetical protein
VLSANFARNHTTSNGVQKAFVLSANFARNHNRWNSVHKAFVLSVNSALADNSRCGIVLKAI